MTKTYVPHVKVIEMSVEKAEEHVCACKSDIEWLGRRIDSINEDYRRLRKVLRIVIAILVDKKLVGENVAKTFTESKEKVDVDKLIKWLVENP